jgi:hypothetical protein
MERAWARGRRRASDTNSCVGAARRVTAWILTSRTPRDQAPRGPYPAPRVRSTAAPVSQRSPAIRLPPGRSRPAPQPGQGRRRPALAPPGARPGRRAGRGAHLPRIRRRQGLYRIAEALTRDGILCPSAHDPTRNRHRDGVAWSKSPVRAILRNPALHRQAGVESPAPRGSVDRRQRRRAWPRDPNDLGRARQTHTPPSRDERT